MSVPKRPRFSRWRRLPSVFRSHEFRGPDPSQDPTRLTLYPPGEMLDRAEAYASRLGFENVQEYCAALLAQGIEDERIREQVAEVEAKRGALEGLHEIADDPEYLEELRSASAIPRRRSADEDVKPSMVSIRLAGSDLGAEAVRNSDAARVVFRHAAQGSNDPISFLAYLRRGEPVPQSEYAELVQALRELESMVRSERSLDRQLAFALHRLAYESQVLHTDAWPGAFDASMVAMIREVQESVERILSGQDIRYSPPHS